MFRDAGWVGGWNAEGLVTFSSCRLFFSKSREAGTEAELSLCCPRGYRQQSCQVLSLEELRQRLTLLGQMRRLLRGVSLPKLPLCNSRQLWTLSGSSITLSGWIHSHRCPMWPEKALRHLCSPHLSFWTAVVSPRRQAMSVTPQIPRGRGKRCSQTSAVGRRPLLARPEQGHHETTLSACSCSR